VFSVDPESGWGYSEETKPMLMTTSHGFIPGTTATTWNCPDRRRPDGKWIFINGNNTPRIARIT
jgi:nitrous-oxide reductase